MNFLVSNNEIKLVRSLAQKKYRDLHGLFVVEGEKMVAEARRSGFIVDKVYLQDEVGEAAMARLSMMSSPSPALAVLKKPADSVIEDVREYELPGKGLFLVLDGVRDPGNLGTILRIADWFGIDAVFASGDTVDIFNPKVVQASMGAIFRVKFHYCDIVSLCSRFSLAGGSVYGTFLDGDDIYSKELNLGDVSPSAIVVGNEANGISGDVAQAVTARLFIPPYPRDCRGSESLNVAVATAVAVAEFRRTAI